MTNKERIILLGKTKQMPQAEIARTVGVSAPRVSQVLKEAGFSRGRGFQPGASRTSTARRTRNAEIRALYKSGKHTHRTLAERFGMSRQRVNQIVNPKAYKASLEKAKQTRRRARRDTITTVAEGPSSPVPQTFADRIRAQIQELQDLLTRVERFQQFTTAG